MILETIPFLHNSSEAQVALVQVEYSEGDPATYLLPLAFATDKQTEEVKARLPHAAVARLGVRQPGSNLEGDAQGLLYDPVGEKTFSESVLESIPNKSQFTMLPFAPPCQEGSAHWSVRQGSFAPALRPQAGFV